MSVRCCIGMPVADSVTSPMHAAFCLSLDLALRSIFIRFPLYRFSLSQIFAKPDRVRANQVPSVPLQFQIPLQSMPGCQPGTSHAWHQITVSSQNTPLDYFIAYSSSYPDRRLP